MSQNEIKIGEQTFRVSESCLWVPGHLFPQIKGDSDISTLVEKLVDGKYQWHPSLFKEKTQNGDAPRNMYYFTSAGRLESLAYDESLFRFARAHFLTQR